MLSNNLDNLRRFDLNHVIKAGMVSLVLCLIVIYGGPARSADEYVFYKYYDDIGEIVHTDEILEDTWVVFFTRYIDRFPKKYVDCVVVEKNGWKFSILISPLPSNVLGLDNIVYFNRFDREYFLYYSTGVYGNIDKILVNNVPANYIELEPRRGIYYLLGQADDTRFKRLPNAPLVIWEN